MLNSNKNNALISSGWLRAYYIMYSIAGGHQSESSRCSCKRDF